MAAPTIYGKFRKNMPLIRPQISALLKNTSKTVTCIWLIVFISYSFSFFDGAIDVISVTPGYFLPTSFRIWTAISFCFLESHFWNVCIDVVMIGICGKVIEPLWGPTEIISFFIIVNIGVALLSSSFYLLIFMCTSNPDLLFNVHIHGLSGYISGVTVAIKQIMPDILVVNTPIGRITNKNVPLLVIIFTLVLWILHLSPSAAVIMNISGVYVSWIYLRYYQRHATGSKGDMSDSFNFASFFPKVVQPPIAVLANTIYSLLIKMKICRRRTVFSADLSSVTVESGDHLSQDVERRKKKAMKALTEHLNKADRPRVAGTIVTQKVKISSPEKKLDIVASPNSAFESLPEKEPLIAVQSSIDHSAIDLPI